MGIGHQRLVSILIPQLTGGGAEKFTANLAALLDRDALLSRIYLGTGRCPDVVDEHKVVRLHGARAIGAGAHLRSALTGDRASVFLLTLGYVNLAPVLRMLRPKARIVLRIGNTLTPELRTVGGLSRLRYLSALRIATGFADQIIVQSDYMGRDLASHLSRARNKLATAYNFVEDGLWQYDPPTGAPIPGRYLFTAASFKPQKAHDVLLAAYAGSHARKEGVRLVVAGVPADHSGFSALMREQGLTDAEVIRPGFIQPYAWIAHAELCVLASRYEGFSNFLLECAALGKRIVATECPGGNAELFAQYPNARCVPTDDPEALAEAMACGRRDLARDEARKHLRLFEKNPVYARYRALLLGEDADASPAGACPLIGTV